MEKGHKQTNNLLTQTKKNSKSDYIKSYLAIKQKFIDEFSKININDKMTGQEKLIEANKYNRLNNLTDIVVKQLLEANKTAINNINKQTNNIYQMNYNNIAKQLKNDNLDINNVNKSESREEVKDNPNPYNNIAINTNEDTKQLKREIQNSLLNSILSTASVGATYKSLQKVFEKNLLSSLTMATTQATRVENMARLKALEEANKQAKKYGYVIVKIWNTQGDNKVRDRHARADGQEAELDKPFYVGGEKLMYPGDINGSPGNVINCRCYLTYRLTKK